MIVIKKKSINSVFRAEAECYTFYAHAYSRDRKSTEHRHHPSSAVTKASTLAKKKKTTNHNQTVSDHIIRTVGIRESN